MKTIGFAGTAKNTGKTTTVLSVIEAMRAHQKRIALTSIGYDGEQLDTITGLPKPRYSLEPGDLVATATDCLESGNARLKILKDTGCQTILGQIVIAKVAQAGTVLVCGPNRQRDLDKVITAFKETQTDVLLVDGALNRLVPMILCDGLVLSTGGAYNVSYERVATHISTLVSLFQLEQEDTTNLGNSHSVWIHKNGMAESRPAAWSLGMSTAELSVDPGNPLQMAILPGIVNPEQLVRWLEAERGSLGTPDPITFVFGSPLKMIASGHIDHWAKLISDPSIKVKVMKTLPLICLTVNPFYARPMQRHNQYEAASLDHNLLLESIRKAVTSISVFDVATESRPDWSELLDI